MTDEADQREVDPEFLPDDEPGLKAALRYLQEWIIPGLLVPPLALPVIACGMVRAVDRARREAANVR